LTHKQKSEAWDELRAVLEQSITAAEMQADKTIANSKSLQAYGIKMHIHAYKVVLESMKKIEMKTK